MWGYILCPYGHRFSLVPVSRILLELDWLYLKPSDKSSVDGGWSLVCDVVTITHSQRGVLSLLGILPINRYLLRRCRVRWVGSDFNPLMRHESWSFPPLCKIEKYDFRDWYWHFYKVSSPRLNTTPAMRCKKRKVVHICNLASILKCWINWFI